MAIKIYTKSVSVWDESAGSYVTDDAQSEWRWYDGPMAMAKKGGKAPPPPDPYKTADAQTQAGKEAAAYNNAITHGSTYTPWGQQTYTGRVDPTTGATVYDQTISLDPQQQQLLDIYNANDLKFGQASQGMLDRVTGTLGQPMDTSGLPALQGSVQMGQFGQAPQLGGYQTNAGQSDQLDINGPGIRGTLDTPGLPQLYGADDLQGARQQVQDALYQRQASYLDPQWQQREQAERTRLANMGVVEGSEAYRNAIDALDRGRAFDYGQARNSAIAGGGDELSRLVNIAQGNRGQMFGERQAEGAFQNNAQAQALAQALAQGNYGNNARLANATFSNAATGQANQDLMAQAGFNQAATAAQNQAALQAAGFGNQARAQGLEQLFALRNQPMNEYNALRSAAQVAQPQFQNAQNSLTNPTDIAGLINQNYQQQMDIWNAKQQQNNSFLSGLFGLGGAALGNPGLFGK